MKISYNWLKRHLNIDIDVIKASEMLTSIGLEVEGITDLGNDSDILKGVIVGKVLSIEKHPNADKLRIAKVNLGDDKETQIVCGAPNLEEGQKVAVATIGTVLFDDKGKETLIEEAEIRGQTSFGMICSEKELNLGENSDGIMVLDFGVKVGTAVKDLFQREKDHTIEIGLTPNRADAMSHFGVARDLYAAFKSRKQKAELIQPNIKEYPEPNSVISPISIEVVDPKAAPRYAGIHLTNVKVQPSPTWLQYRLKSIGLTPINNVVDITNYVLHDLGQPLHAFDADKIVGNKIIVQTLPEGSKFTTLDGIERTLKGTELMICDEKGGLCIAGVFGGKDSGISEETTNIFLESAYFDSITVRKAAKAHGLNTDSSFRFERGVDPNMTVIALKRAALLLKEHASAEITSDIIDFYPEPIKDHNIVLRYHKLDQLLGERIHREQIKEILNLLDVKIISELNEGLDVRVPAFRVDVVREVDLIEDILRIYGYNNINVPDKIQFSSIHSNQLNKEKVEDFVARQLNSLGFYEAMNNSLTKKEYESVFNFIGEESVDILNPLSADLITMRRSLLPGILESIEHNIKHRTNDIKLFEFGNVYSKVDGKYIENHNLAIAISGSFIKESWNGNSRMSGFFDLKGIVQQIFERLNINITNELPTKQAYLSEGITFLSNKIELGTLGTVDKKILKKMDVSQDVFYAQLNWDNIMRLIKNKNLHYKEIPKFPGSRRDLALLLDKDVSYLDLYHASFDLEIASLKSVQLFDVYEGSKLPEGKKSYALSYYLQDREKTLNDAEIDATMQKIITTYKNKFQAELRN